MLDIQMTPFQYVQMVNKTVVSEPLTVLMEILILLKGPLTYGNSRETKLFSRNNQPQQDAP